MLKAIIFDFNGVIIHDEPLHYRSMYDAVAPLGIYITRDEYWGNYLPLDDENCLTAICAAHNRTLTPEERSEVLERKVAGYRALLQGEFPIAPDAAEVIPPLAEQYPLAIASGARRNEIEPALDFAGLRGSFRVIVGAEDFHIGKPHPESFLLALERLNRSLGNSRSVLPHECLVVEDSVGGVHGSTAAGMTCVAVSTTYPREKLVNARTVIDSLSELSPRMLESLFEGNP